MNGAAPGVHALQCLEKFAGCIASLVLGLQIEDLASRPITCRGLL